MGVHTNFRKLYDILSNEISAQHIEMYINEDVGEFTIKSPTGHIITCQEFVKSVEIEILKVQQKEVQDTLITQSQKIRFTLPIKELSKACELTKKALNNQL